MARRVLSDAHWAIVEPFCPGTPKHPGQTGRDPRLFMKAVLWIVRTGAQWRELPDEFGKWNWAAPRAEPGPTIDDRDTRHMRPQRCQPICCKPPTVPHSQLKTKVCSGLNTLNV